MVLAVVGGHHQVEGTLTLLNVLYAPQGILKVPPTSFHAHQRPACLLSPAHTCLPPAWLACLMGRA